jgi:hypothetical protein
LPRRRQTYNGCRPSGTRCGVVCAVSIPPLNPGVGEAHQHPNPAVGEAHQHPPVKRQWPWDAQGEAAETSALEEAQQLSDLVQQLLMEKTESAAAMQKLKRERQYLSEENTLLRHQLTVGTAGGWVGGCMVVGIAV